MDYIDYDFHVEVASMTVNEVKRQHRLAEWASLIEEQKRSGLTVRGWCKEHHVSVSTFYLWQNRLFKSITVKQPMVACPTEPSFVEVTPIKQISQSTPSICLQYDNVKVSIESGADPATVQAVILALQKSC